MTTNYQFSFISAVSSEINAYISTSAWSEESKTIVARINVMQSLRSRLVFESGQKQNFIHVFRVLLVFLAAILDYK